MQGHARAAPSGSDLWAEAAAGVHSFSDSDVGWDRDGSATPPRRVSLDESLSLRCATAPLRHCATAPLRHCATARHTLRLPQQPCGERGMPPHVPAQRKPGGGKCPRSAPQHPSPAAAPLICFSSRPRRYSRPNATVTGIWLHVDSYWVGLC